METNEVMQAKGAIEDNEVTHTQILPNIGTEWVCTMFGIFNFGLGDNKPPRLIRRIFQRIFLGFKWSVQEYDKNERAKQQQQQQLNKGN